MTSRTVRQMMVRVAIAAAILAPIVWLVKARQEARQKACQSLCSGHCTQIVLALYNYHSAYGTFPPAYLTDAEGRPMHSWRVLILPFIEQQALYEQYDFNEPWDGPNNRKLAPLMPKPYACPNHHGSRYRVGLTSHLAITGPGSAFPGAESTSLDSIFPGAEMPSLDAPPDGPTGTILVAEVANADIPWMAPIDLDIRTMPLTINGPTGPSISSMDPDGPAVIFANGERKRLNANITPAELRALLTIDGGETIEAPPR